MAALEALGEGSERTLRAPPVEPASGGAALRSAWPEGPQGLRTTLLSRLGRSVKLINRGCEREPHGAAAGGSARLSRERVDGPSGPSLSGGAWRLAATAWSQSCVPGRQVPCDEGAGHRRLSSEAHAWPDQAVAARRHASTR
jgi:hypothetical protein